MTQIEESLARLSFPEKMHVLDIPWADLSRQETESDSPAWHQTVLEDRDAALAEGRVTVSGWQAAKERIRDSVS